MRHRGHSDGAVVHGARHRVEVRRVGTRNMVGVARSAVRRHFTCTQDAVGGRPLLDSLDPGLIARRRAEADGSDRGPCAGPALVRTGETYFPSPDSNGDLDLDLCH